MTTFCVLYMGKDDAKMRTKVQKKKFAILQV